MPYLIYLPGLLCGLALSAEDVRRRRVPRPWVAAGAAAQLIADCLWAAADNDFFIVMQALLFAALCVGVQCLLAVARPGTLGLGDVTAMVPVGLAVGMRSLTAIIVWWLALGAIGLLLVTAWTRFDPQRNTSYRGKTPFVPAILLSAIVAVSVPL